MKKKIINKYFKALLKVMLSILGFTYLCQLLVWALGASVTYPLWANVVNVVCLIGAATYLTAKK